MKQDHVFNLFANCIPVKGRNRSIICDVYRKRFRIIPNALYFILTRFNKNTVREIKKHFKNKNDTFIDEYFNFLMENEFGFFCDKEEQKLFPKINLNYETNSIISNCIIDIDQNSNHDFRKLFLQLEELHCHFWQIRIFNPRKLSEIERILLISRNIHLHAIHLIIPFHKSMSPSKILELYHRYPLAQIDIYSVPYFEINTYREACDPYSLLFHEKIISNETHCGKINEYYFNLGLKSFAESQQHNSCLNQKISIDVNGEIKNCPSMKKSYGNIKDISLQQALNKKGFKDVWNIKKDEINICKDCEFRHICTDCRAYIENPDDIYSKPLKCGYNPYTNKWEDWSINPLKQDAIIRYKIQELVTQRDH